jgi:hypothetical protein
MNFLREISTSVILLIKIFWNSSWEKYYFEEINSSILSLILALESMLLCTNNLVKLLNILESFSQCS